MCTGLWLISLISLRCCGFDAGSERELCLFQVTIGEKHAALPTVDKLKWLLDNSTANSKRNSVKTLDGAVTDAKGNANVASLAVARTVTNALDKKMTVRYIFVVPCASRFLKNNKSVFTRTDGVKVELTELHPSNVLIKRTNSPASGGHNQLLPSQQLIKGKQPPHSGRRNYSTLSPPARFALASSTRCLGYKAQHRHPLLPAASTRVAQLLRVLSSL